MNGIFGSHVFSGFGQIGLGLIDLDKTRANLINIGKSAADIANIMVWAQKLRDLQARIGDGAARNSTTDATYAHYLQAMNPNIRLTTEQSQALAHEAQQAYMSTHPSGLVATAPPPTEDEPPATLAVAEKSNLPLIVGGAVAVAAVGGLLYWKFGRRTAKAA